MTAGFHVAKAAGKRTVCNLFVNTEEIRAIYNKETHVMEDSVKVER